MIFRKIRRWDNTADTPPTQWAYLDGNSFVLEFVGGAIANGDYTLNLLVLLATGETHTTIPITTTRTAGEPATYALMGPAMATAINTAIATNPENIGQHDHPGTYLRSAASSDAQVFVICKSNPKFRFRLSVSVPGGAALALNPDDLFPIDYVAPSRGLNGELLTDLELVVVPVSSADVALDPGSLTCNITVRRMVDRSVLGVPGVFAAPAEVEADHPVGQPFRIEAGPGRYTFELGVPGGSVGSGSLDALELQVGAVLK
jgi:hypothetical protein